MSLTSYHTADQTDGRQGYPLCATSWPSSQFVVYLQFAAKVRVLPVRQFVVRSSLITNVRGR